MLQKMKEFFNSQHGYVLLESIIAIIAIGSVSYYIVNSDLLPGLKTKWDAINSALQGKWIR